MKDKHLYKISDGRVFRLADPNLMVVVNPEAAFRATTVCAVSVRNKPSGMELPVFAVFVEKPVCKLRRHPDLDAIDAAIVKAFPSYRKVLEAKVEPRFDTEGRCVNAKAHLSAPYAGYFDLGVWPDYWVGDTVRVEVE